MEEKKTQIDVENQIYEKVEANRQKYADLMAEDEVANAVKFNQMLNKRMEKLGIKPCTYIPQEEDNDRED